MTNRDLNRNLRSLMGRTDEELREARYHWGPAARAGRSDGVRMVQTIDSMREIEPEELFGEDYYDETDYSGWYGGEQGYRDGLRWSDFI